MTPKQRSVIPNRVTFQFKERIKDLLKPEYTDYYLTKWLKGMHNTVNATIGI